MRGTFSFYLVLKNFKYVLGNLWSQTIGAKVYSQEGNSPDYTIRTLIFV